MEDERGGERRGMGKNRLRKKISTRMKRLRKENSGNKRRGGEIEEGKEKGKEGE